LKFNIFKEAFGGTKRGCILIEILSTVFALVGHPLFIG